MAEKKRTGESLTMEIGSNKPFLLDDPDGAWLIEAGAVNVFSVPLKDREPAGAHRHLYKAGAGEVLFGVPADGSNGGTLGFLAVGVSGTRLKKVGRAGLKELDNRVSLVENWVRGLVSGIAAEMFPPKEALPLESEGEVSLPAEGSACAKKGMVWVKPLSGRPRYFARENLPLPASPAFSPLCDHLWIQTPEEAKIQCVSTQEMLRRESGWENLEAFHRFVFGRLREERENARLDEAKRYRQREESDQTAVKNAFSQLASIIEGGKRGRLMPEASPDLLVTACRWVGEPLGIAIREHPEARRGIQIKDPLRAIARASRIRIRQVVLKGNWWKRDNGPLLASFEESGQPVALLPVSPTEYEMVNPADGTRQKVTEELAYALNGLAYAFYRPFPEKALHLKNVLSFAVRGLGGDLWRIALFGVLIGLLGLLTPLATGKIFDSIIPGAEKGQLVQMTLALIVAAVATAAFTITRSISIQRVSGKVDASIQAAVWDRLLNLPAPFFRDYSAGDLAARACGMNAITQVLSGTVVTAILGGIFGLFNIALLFYYSVKLALIACGLIVVAVVVMWIAGRRQLRFQAQQVQKQGEISGMVLQLIANGIAKIRVAGAEDRAFARWAHPFTEQKRLDYRGRVVTNWMTVFQQVFPVLCTFVIFIFVSKMLFGPGRPAFSTGSFLAFNSAFSSFLAAALATGTTFVTALLVVPFYRRMKPILESLPEVAEAKSDPGELRGNVEVKNVTFRYRPDGPVVLDHVSFEAREGEFVAFVGPSGSGKSTLMRLLLGFEKPEAGSIYMDGQELSGLDLRAVRQQTGVVLQNGKLLSGDIFTNIVGSAPLTQEDAWEAVRMAGMEKDIADMPMQLFTVVSEGGSTLSGGQRQRLMIARAIVKKPRLLIFDEATSALDNETQSIVSRSLESLKATRIVIAHRLSTIQNADRIYVLVNGRMLQSGTYDELVKQEGPFLELVKRQIA